MCMSEYIFKLEDVEKPMLESFAIAHGCWVSHFLLTTFLLSLKKWMYQIAAGLKNRLAFTDSYEDYLFLVLRYLQSCH